jgi:GPN-loop GTPase
MASLASDGSANLPAASGSSQGKAGAKPASGAENGGGKKNTPPISVIVLGMAGSGKTTLMQRINAHVHEKKIPSYMVNMDPAVTYMPYGANVDIRDTVKYKEVMKQYNLGPNGAILTSLNLFATRFDKLMNILEKRADEQGLDYIFFDTPGQIEVFTWSASGTIITETLATSFPTVLVYVIDTPRTTDCTTFMSNMLYACSILYKMKLPFVIAFNKIDVTSHQFALDWMADFEAYQEALDKEKSESYMSSLMRSMSLVLDEFYSNIRAVGVSAATGQGMDDLFVAIGEGAKEYAEDYLPALKERVQQTREKEAAKRDQHLQQFREDAVASGDSLDSPAGGVPAPKT